MKKIIGLVVTFLSIFMLVSCTGEVASNVSIKEINHTQNIYEAELHINLEVETLDGLKEVVHSSINQLYQEKKENFGTKVMTLYITVFLKDNKEAGQISFKVNQSIDKPGLSYIKDNLSI